MKELSRKTSFIVILLVYLSAIAVGVLSYLYIPVPFYWGVLIADVVATIWTYIFSCIFKNASVYDPYWSVKPVVIVLAFCIGRPLGLFQILMAVVVSLWGIRLTLNWAYTFHGLKYEDWRYVRYRSTTGKLFPIVSFLGIHLVPTIVTYAVTIPCGFALLLPDTGASILSYLCLLLSTFAFSMQGLADVQMHKYRKNRTTIFIEVGLWKYSRHPNYLGEILMWWGVGLACCIYTGLWYLIIGAVMNTLLFLFVSIPLADGRQSRKDGFSEYKSRTRMLLPIARIKK